MYGLKKFFTSTSSAQQSAKLLNGKALTGLRKRAGTLNFRFALVQRLKNFSFLKKTVKPTSLLPLFLN
jgi:hypothetical protein